MADEAVVHKKGAAVLNSLYPIVPNGISALFYDKKYFWHARRTAIAQRLQ